MGQYYIIVNKTKKEFLYPHIFNDGSKAAEILHNGSTLKGLGLLLLEPDDRGGGDLAAQDDENNPIVGRWAGDEIVIIGDYDSSGLYETASDHYTDISFHVLELMVQEGIYNTEYISNWMIDEEGERGYNLRKIVAGVALDPLPSDEPGIIILEPVDEKPVSWLACVEIDDREA